MQRDLLSKLVLSFGSLLLTLLLAEGLARLWLDPPQEVEIQEADPEGVTASVALASHPEQGGVFVLTETGRRLRPNLHVTINHHALSKRRIEFTTNSLGYRNPEIGPKQGLRILHLGDSITCALYLLDDETYVRQLEIGARASGRGWETINAGVGAISLATEFAILLETGLTTQPDVVVIGFYLNDFLDSRAGLTPVVPYFVRHSRLLHHLWLSLGTRAEPETEMLGEREEIRAWAAEFEQSLLSRREDLDEEDQRFYGAVLRRFGDWGGAWSPHAWQRMRATFEEFKRLSQEHEFQLLILGFPVRHQVESPRLYDFPQRQLQVIGEELDIPVLDLLPVLRQAHHGDGSSLFYDQCHHTPLGNELIARETLAFFEHHLE